MANISIVYDKIQQCAVYSIFRVVSTETANQNAFLTKLKKEGKLQEYLEKEPNFMYSLLADGRLSEDQISSVVSDLFGAGIDSVSRVLNQQ